MAYATAKESFEIVLKEITTIENVNKDETWKKFDRIENEIDTLSSSHETWVNETSIKTERLKKKLIELNDQEVRLTNAEKRLKEIRTSLRAEEKALENKK